MPVNGSAQNLAQGTTPIYFDWDYNLLAMRDQLAGTPPVEVVIPADSVLAGVYIQTASAYAPHPSAAKLWMEFLYSDEGQLLWLAGYCHPIRFNALSAAGKLPADLMAKLPRQTPMAGRGTLPGPHCSVPDRAPVLSGHRRI